MVKFSQRWNNVCIFLFCAIAFISILNRVSIMLTTNPYVHLILLDFTKAFDTLRHNTLLEKIYTLHLPDNVLNWNVNYLSDPSHSTTTKNNETVSNSASINASVIQGSTIGLVTFIIAFAELRLGIGNSGSYLPSRIDKYADDCILVVSAFLTHTISAEMSHISQ